MCICRRIKTRTTQLYSIFQLGLKIFTFFFLLDATQRGPNRVPVYALIVAALVTLLFIWVGQLNTLAPIVTMPFLLTYAAIDYAYFALAQTFNIHEERDQRFKSVSRPVLLN